MSDEAPILIDEPAPFVRRITLNRPERRNAISNEMRGALLECLQEADGNDAVRVSIVRGAGPCFSSGYDLKSDLSAGQVVEQIGNGRLTTGNQNAVGADFLVDVTLTSSPRPKFTDVEVVLDQWNHAAEQVPLHSLFKLSWLVTAGSQQCVDPLLFGEVSPPFEQLIHVHVGHLDRLEFFDGEGFIIGGLCGGIAIVGHPVGMDE